MNDQANGKKKKEIPKVLGSLKSGDYDVRRSDNIVSCFFEPIKSKQDNRLDIICPFVNL